MKLKPEKYTLVPLPDGRWKCHENQMRSSWSYGATPNEAIENARVCFENFKAFCARMEELYPSLSDKASNQ